MSFCRRANFPRRKPLLVSLFTGKIYNFRSEKNRKNIRSSKQARKQRTQDARVRVVFNRYCRARDIELSGLAVITGGIKGMKIIRGIIYTARRAGVFSIPHHGSRFTGTADIKRARNEKSKLTENIAERTK